MASFLRSLKERKLVQWGLAYLAGAWLVLQVMDTLGDLFALPLPLLRGVFALLVIGLPTALVLAWFHGERGHQRVTGPEILLLAVLLAAGGLGFALLTAATAGARAGAADAPPPGHASAADRGDPAFEGDARPSVAVLPFRDLSPGSDQAYFAAGIHEEIISQLARIDGLKVISRTSVMRYANGDATVRQVASELGVGAVLEGGVRHAGDSVRITATLVDARTDAPLWSETYDQGMARIFAIQEDVAREIVRALSATLTPEESRRLERHPTPSLSAYELYLLSRHRFHQFGPEGLARSRELAERALAEDSTFAPAWLALGRALLVMGLGHAEVGEGPDDEVRAARSALERALSLDPGLAEARAALALILATYDYDLEGALRESELATLAAPGNAIAAEVRGLVLSTAGRDEEAIHSARRALDLDPLAPVIRSNLGWVYLNAGRYDDAIAQARRVLESEPDFHDALTLLGRASIRTGRYEDAIAAYRRGADVSDRNPEDLGGLAHALARSGARDEARSVLAELLEAADRRFVPPLHVGYAYLGLDEDDRALDWFERAVTERGGWTVWLPRYPEARRLHDHPRFQRIVERMGLDPLADGPGTG